jgi:hypothetical protein
MLAAVIVAAVLRLLAVLRLPSAIVSWLPRHVRLIAIAFARMQMAVGPPAMTPIVGQAAFALQVRQRLKRFPVFREAESL